MKKLLVLTGNYYQIPAIKKAKKMGNYVITCDYLDDNLGHCYADESHHISYTDKEAVLELAKSLKVDGIVCFSTDAAATTVAYVAEKLGLPSQPYKSVEIISNKENFRTFLKEHNFSVPKAKGYQTFEEAKNDFPQFHLPVIIKPVDSSGSRGVSKIDCIDELQEKVENALRFSRNNRFIIEEIVEKRGYQVGGDGFSVNGKLVFRCFANSHFPETSLKPVNPFVPIGSSFPSKNPEHIQEKIHEEIQRLLDLLEMKTGAYNFDIQIDEFENIYILDMGVRNGGNLIPYVTECATGVDMIEYTIKAALGEDCSDLEMVTPKGCWASYSIHSQVIGQFKKIEIEENFKVNHVVEYDLTVKKGDQISDYTGSDAKIGTMILKFFSMDEMLVKMENMTNWIKITVDQNFIKI